MSRKSAATITVDRRGSEKFRCALCLRVPFAIKPNHIGTDTGLAPNCRSMVYLATVIGAVIGDMLQALPEGLRVWHPGERLEINDRCRSLLSERSDVV